MSRLFRWLNLSMFVLKVRRVIRCVLFDKHAGTEYTMPDGRKFYVCSHCTRVFLKVRETK